MLKIFAFVEQALQIVDVRIELCLEFVGGDVGVFDFDFEVLSGAERVVFALDITVISEHREIVLFLTGIERVDDSVDFLVGKHGALGFADLFLGAEAGCVHQQRVVMFLGFVQEDDGHVGAGVGEDAAGHGDDPTQHVLVDHAFADGLLDGSFGGEESRGHHDGRLASGFQGHHDVLDEHQVDGHLAGVFLRYIGHPGPEALGVFVGGEHIPVVGEIAFERRIAHDVVEMFDRIAIVLQVSWRGQRVVVHDVGERFDLPVEDKVEAHELVGLLRAVLRVDGAAVLADLMREGEHERSGASRRIVHRDVPVAVGYEDLRHDAGDGVRGEVFAVAAGILVVVLDQVFEDLREEVVALRQHVIKAEVHEGGD